LEVGAAEELDLIVYSELILTVRSEWVKNEALRPKVGPVKVALEYT
jgi:hypothetical protein